MCRLTCLNCCDFNCFFNFYGLILVAGLFDIGKHFTIILQSNPLNSNTGQLLFSVKMLRNGTTAKTARKKLPLIQTTQGSSSLAFGYDKINRTLFDLTQDE